MGASKSPWYISAHAVRRYLALVRRPVVDDGPEFTRAERALAEMAAQVVEDVRAGIKRPREIRPGLLKYRGPRPLRLGLMVSTEPRPEGPLPQLVDVLPSHDGGVGAGKKRALVGRVDRDEADSPSMEPRRAQGGEKHDPQPQATVEVTATSDGWVRIEFRSPFGGWRQRLSVASARKLAQSLIEAASQAERPKEA